MHKINLKGLERAVKELNKTIIIRKDDFSKEHIDKDLDLRIDLIKDEEVVNGVTTDNLIKGLIVCSNYYLPIIEAEDIKKVKTKLEKAIRKGAEVKIEKFSEKSMHLVVRINGKNKYNFYGYTFAEIFKLVEESNKMLAAELERVGL